MRLIGRAAVLGAAGGMTATALGALTVRTWSQAAHAGRVDAVDAVSVVSAGAATALCLWLLLGTVLAALAVVPGAVGAAAQSVADRFVPAAVHRVAAWVLTASVSTVAFPATAVAASSATWSVGRQPAPAVTYVPSSAQPGAGSVAAPTRPVDATPTPPPPQFVPERPTVRPSPTPTVGPPPRDVSPDTPSAPASDRSAGIVVIRGDSLWSIAAAHLGPGATDAEVAAAWPRWWAANRHVIGSDPDLLRPGQILRPPAVVTS